ncbi:hypothetical protein [Acetobacter okinawensis]|uniref:hypothetical protein n=1 Tax=Acetobacter okinawensis TaxID=1076594 RepID=UPI000ACD72B4|nr:hypothetical protein [Acetobacter okinawensis]
MAQTDHASSRMNLYAGWLTVDGQCYPFGAETKRRCLQMIAQFICSMAEMHAEDQRKYPDTALLCPYWYSGVYTNSEIRRLASDETLDPDMLDDMMQHALDDYFSNPDIKITALVSPLLVPVVGQTVGDTLFIAMLDKDHDFAGYVTTEEEVAERWLTEYVAQVFGPSVGKPGMSVDAAKKYLKGKGLIHICPLPLSPNLKMVFSLAALTPQAA